MREAGYYWIKMAKTDDWEVAYYDPREEKVSPEEGGWFSIWSGGCYRDDELIEIDESKLEHDE
jgi:hypothetical protein